MVKQPILVELEHFINGVANFYSLSPNASAKLAQCSLNLLENLPASREAIFEYFAILFDASVGSYVKSIDKDPNAAIAEDESIADIQEALEKLVIEGQHAWAPYISDWSLKILGILSNKFGRQGHKDIGTACNYWLGCSAMRCLLGLTAHCFEKLTSRETEECIATLLNTYVMNSPHFDWVVARLGGCFPFKVISKILHCGLKAFASNSHSGLDSEVGILAYLSFAQEIHLQTALKEMLQDALQKTAINSQPQLSTIPYLLQLGDKSSLLLQPMISVFLEIYDNSMIPILIQQSKSWPQNFNVNDILPALSSLALQLQQNATRNILLIAKIAESYVWCQDLLEHILQDIENLLHEGRSCALSADIIKDSSKKLIMNSCLNGKLMEQQTAVRLILLFARHSSFMYQTVIIELLTYDYETGNTNGLGALIRLIPGPTGYSELITATLSIQLAFESVLIQGPRLENENVERNYNILRNILVLLKLEKQNASPHLKQMLVTATIPICVPTILQIAARYLDSVMGIVGTSTLYVREKDKIQASPPINKKIKTELTETNKIELEHHNLFKRHIHTIFELLDVSAIGAKDDTLCMTDIIKLSQLSSRYFFWVMVEEDPVQRLVAVNRSISLLSRQCSSRRYTRIAALRELLEGALFTYGNLFGTYNDVEIPAAARPKANGETSLMKLNQSQNAASTLRGTTLHAGTIGNGLKTPAKESVEPLPESRSMLLRAISACCNSDDVQKSVDGFSSVSLLLVELVSTDVMYNGLPWPDEEFTKVTMERDLQIRRTIKNAPILWSILALVATHRPSICFASVLLRGLCASLLHQWRAKSVIQYPTADKNRELYDVTKRLLEIMSMGQILPPPFNFLHSVIEHFEPPEIALVLKECIWNYMKENVPSPVIYNVDMNGLHWRDSLAARPHPQFIDPLRNIMLRKLPLLGTFYHHMFVLPEVNHPGGPQAVGHPIVYVGYPGPSNITKKYFEECQPSTSAM